MSKLGGILSYLSDSEFPAVLKLVGGRGGTRDNDVSNAATILPQDSRGNSSKLTVGIRLAAHMVSHHGDLDLAATARAFHCRQEGRLSREGHGVLFSASPVQLGIVV